MQKDDATLLTQLDVKCVINKTIIPERGREAAAAISWLHGVNYIHTFVSLSANQPLTHQLGAAYLLQLPLDVSCLHNNGSSHGVFHRFHLWV